MQTRKLFYEDCHLRQFTARVLSCTPGDRGYEIELDATAFYPGGGGQSCDTGVLADARVIQTREEGERILHLCDRALAVGETVTGRIDYDRRFDQMQQHTGEHIVSGLIHARFGYHNVGFHVGTELMEVDFDGPISPEELRRIEEEANRAVWENLPVRCFVPSPEELPNEFYRTKRPLPWPVRIVRVGDVDSCACCGIHTAFTGEVGLIKIFSCVKFHQGVRLEMACGERALSYLSRVYEQNRQVSQTFSAKVLETGAAAVRMNALLAEEKYRVAALQKQVFQGIAESYVNHSDVVHFEDGLEPAAVRELADAIAERCGGTAAVFSGSDGAWDLCLASRGGDVKALGTALAKALDGRGGGKPGFFQGRVRAQREQIEAFFENR